MEYLEQDNKELQDTWELLWEAIIDLKNSNHLSQTEKEEKALVVRRLNRRYETLCNRTRYNKIVQTKIVKQNKAIKFFKGAVIVLSATIFIYFSLLVFSK